MKTLILAILCCFRALALDSSPASMARLESLLTEARIAWGVDVAEPITFRVEPLNSCNLLTKPDVALIEVHWVDETITFEGAPPVTTRSYTYIIRMNARCDWSRLPMLEVVEHEYGHILTGLGHSKDRHSVMYPIPAAGAMITEADRDRVAIAVAVK